MESMNTSMHLMSKNCYFASVELCDAYYSVPIISDIAEHCSKNVNETINLLSELGFIINYEKSVLNTGTFNKI